MPIHPVRSRRREVVRTMAPAISAVGPRRFVTQVEPVAKTVPASNFVQTVAANIDNEQMNDKEFREFVRRTLPIVQI